MASNIFLNKAFMAYFGRPADLSAVTDFASVSEAQVQQSFAASAESRDLFGDTFNAKQINSFYQALFGRDAEQAGIDYWLDRVNDGTYTKAGASIAILEGAQNADAVAIANKLLTSSKFTSSLSPDKTLYAGTADAILARDFLKTISEQNATQAQIDKILAEIEGSSAVEKPTTPVEPIAGQTYALTVGADNLSPNAAVAASKTTAGDDLVRAVTANSLETTDAIDAGTGVDTLKANFTVTDATGADDAQTTLTVKPLLSNLEKVFVNATLSNGTGQAGGGMDGAVATLDLTDATGVQELWNEGSTASATTANATSAVNFTNVKLSTTVGVKDTTVSTNVTFAAATGAADAATIVLADAGTATASALITVGTIEKLTLNSTTGSVTAVTANEVILQAAQAETVIITGDQNLKLNLTSLPFANVVDASAFTKSLSLLFFTSGTGVVAAGVTIKSGVGADIIDVADISGGPKFTVDLGVGADTLSISSTAFHKITLGDGADTVNLGTSTSKAIDVSSATRLATSVIEITDFKSGTDTLNITNGGTGTEITLTGTQLATINNSSDLLTAAKAAAALLGTPATDGTTVTFQFGGDSYVLVDEQQTTANTLETGDVLIKLTGVTSTVAADVVVS
jgi:hypothetical protein